MIRTTFVDSMPVGVQVLIDNASRVESVQGRRFNEPEMQELVDRIVGDYPFIEDMINDEVENIKHSNAKTAAEVDAKAVPLLAVAAAGFAAGAAARLAGKVVEKSGK